MSRHLLLDTHAFLWLTDNDPKLSPAARASAVDAANAKYVSEASLWEIAIKVSVGKLDLNIPLPTLLDRLDRDPAIHRLPVRNAHLLRYAVLPLHHRDPFDRMIVTQTLCEDFTLVSNDGLLDPYGVRRLW